MLSFEHRPMDCGLPYSSGQQPGKGGACSRREEQGNVPEFYKGDADVAAGGPKNSKTAARRPLAKMLGDIRLETRKWAKRKKPAQFRNQRVS